MKRRLLMAGAALCAVAGVEAAQAETFQRSPEANWSPPWVGVFPYQRDIAWSFSVNPVGGPSASGTPGADYEGSLDPGLKASDVVSFTGAVQWFTGANSPDGQAGFGVDNTTGSATLTGTAVFTLGNVTDGFPEKNVWVELTGEASDNAPGPESTIGVIANGVTYSPTIQLPDEPIGSLYLQDYGFILTPNPSGEQVVFTFTVAPGTSDVFNTLQIATQSVPELSTWAMMGLGFAGLGFAGYRAKARKPAFAG